MRYSLSMLLLLPALLAPAVGCKPEERITHYRAPKSKEPMAAIQPAQAKTDGMLGAIVPHGAQAWFFKLTGPVEAVAANGDAFRKFVQSVHFAGDELRYDPPADWRAQGASGLRQETFLIPSAAKPLELAISTLAKPADDDETYLLSNINRWRGQMGLEPIDSGQIADNTNRLKLADGVTATLVAMAGSVQSGGMAGPQSGGTARPAATSPRDSEPAGAGAGADGMLAAIVPQNGQAWFFKLNGPAASIADQRDAFRKFIESVRFDGDELRYSPPADWRPQGGAGMRYETFRIPSAGQTLELAVSTLVKPPGDAEDYLLANVNRWRGQLGLAPIERSQLTGQTTQVKLTDDQVATLVELVGKLPAGGNAPPFAPGK